MPTILETKPDAYKYLFIHLQNTVADPFIFNTNDTFSSCDKSSVSQHSGYLTPASIPTGSDLM
jgi:hypothetical protein